MNALIAVAELIDRAAERGVRKVVLATNIAETAITIDDVSFVVDCGRMNFDAEKRMESLEDVSVCRSNAKQRRAGSGPRGPGAASTC